KLESQIKNARKRLKAQTKKQIDALRTKAASAARHWVISHEDRVNAFRSSVKGTPVEKALDTLIDILKSNSETPAARRKPAAKKKTAPKKKVAAKKAVKKAVKKAARRR
ncbi:MAG: hypothetical protein V4607_16600, partial [Pseudomonadota bacterium]